MNKRDILPDYLRSGLKIVFCGTAAGKDSAARKAYYAGRGNLFWPTLHKIRLTERLLAPEESASLTQYQIGLTDIAKKTSGADHSLKNNDFCVDSFRERIVSVSPKLIAFNGKKAASIVFGSSTHLIEYGLQQQKFGKCRVFVLPSTSGSARKYWSIDHWIELARIAQEASF